jgi:Secretion system C-terminal sorting domain
MGFSPCILKKQEGPLRPMKKHLLCLVVPFALNVAAQTSVTVPTAPGNAQQTWYSLASDAMTSAPLAEWDLAFEINGGFNAGIMANTQKGLQVFQSPYVVSDWNGLDTNGMAVSWTALHNSDSDWSAGALNGDVDFNTYNLGWGIYNPVTHFVAGDSIYLVHLTTGDWKKLRIDVLSSGTYNFTYANLDGSDEQVHQLVKSAYTGKNFAYWSMATNTALDREPMSADWDLLFGKYMTNLGIWYGVTGVLQNKGVEVVQIDGVPPAQAQMDWDLFRSDIHTIGHDWKTFDMNTFQYVLNDSVTYFVKDIPGNIWKVVFTAFGGSATGDVTFTKELFSAVGIPSVNSESNDLLVYPNPVIDGTAHLLVTAKENNATVSILDLHGRFIRSEALTGLKGFSAQSLDVSDLNAGTYVVQLSGSGFLRTQKLIVQ